MLFGKHSNASHWQNQSYSTKNISTPSIVLSMKHYDLNNNNTLKKYLNQRKNILLGAIQITLEFFYHLEEAGFFTGF